MDLGASLLDMLPKCLARFDLNPILNDSLANFGERWDAALDPFMDPYEVLAKGGFDRSEPGFDGCARDALGEGGAQAGHDAVRRSPAETMARKKGVARGDCLVNARVLRAQQSQG